MQLETRTLIVKGLPIGIAVGVLFMAAWIPMIGLTAALLAGLALGVGMAPLFGLMLKKRESNGSAKDNRN